MLCSDWSIILILTSDWSIILVLISDWSIFSGSLHKNSDNEEALAKKLVDAQKEALSYKRELDSLRTKLLSSGSNADSSVVIEDEPSREYETYRRRAYRDVQELWFFVRSKLDALGKGDSNLGSKVTDIVKDLETREQVIGRHI